MDMMELRRQIVLNEPHIVTTTPDGIASFSTDLIAPLKSCKVEFSPVQAGTGDPSPENVRPISGWNGIHVNYANANLWGGEKLADDIVMKAQGSKNATQKTIYYGASKIAGKILFDNFKSNTQYTVILNGSGHANMQFKYTDGTQKVFSGKMNNEYRIYLSDASKSIKEVTGFWSSGYTTLNYEQCGLFEGNIGLESFIPYSGSTIPIDWTTEAGTVYGGYVDLVTGELVADRQFRKLRDLAVSKNAGSYTTFIVNPLETMMSGQSKTLVISDTFRGLSQDNISSSGDNYVWGSSATGTIGVKATAYENYSSAEFKQMFGEAEFVYLLATPITYQLTPTQLKSLRGVNNIWSDANGDTTVKFWTH